MHTTLKDYPNNTYQCNIISKVQKKKAILINAKTVFNKI